MNKKLAVALSGCAALLLTLSACGGGDGDEEADEWARNVCEGLQPQVEKIQSAYAAIAEVSEGNRSPEEVQEADSAAYQDISEAYEALADVVDNAGDPPVDDGAQVREDAVTALHGLSESFAGLKEDMDALDTSDQAAFAEGLSEIVPRLEELGQSGNEALDELESGELGEALSRQEGCQSPAPSPPTDEQTE
ncbi:small secreted protein [Streptomyces litchfieldiae]|uniref:Small secreted protein n=1 Tax=Streptomyces litchfieldiae TaxID=3075543 RepID=A0ABU2MLS4_9ACTN|nr:small secreted protein [Streptomyces sp. DSM 44938]MDT0341873.1 small secreted protein [Streptomyces sp. DSM 44938]